MRWDYEINLNKVIAELDEEYPTDGGIFSEDSFPEEGKERVIAELNKVPCLRKYILAVEKAKTVSQMNGIFEKVFDTADANRVWCGFP